MPRPKLTPPQIELLTDIATKPQMFITRWSRWDKTAHSLISKGLAAATPGYHAGPQYEITITDAGRVEAARRGLASGSDTSQTRGRVTIDEHTHDWRPLYREGADGVEEQCARCGAIRAPGEFA